MARHHADLVYCRKLPGISIGKLCERHDGVCIICDSYVRPAELVHVCDEHNFGHNEGKCLLCGYPGTADAYYCKSCVLQEKDRDGCPKIVNLGSARTDMYFEKKKYG
ncbi:PHF5-like protein [Gorgonomyces haynaldii]|nr:PHF5-like protein [Gorgonomyces haynaldii]